MAAAISASLAVKTGKPVPFAFDRKEEKKHGEGADSGRIKEQKILIVDDVLTAGTALKRSIEIIIGAGGSFCLCGCIGQRGEDRRTNSKRSTLRGV